MESNKNNEVCFFDSGIGGLNLFYRCVKKYPTINFSYFADNFRVPYGNIDKSVLYQYVEEIFEKISTRNPLAAVVACNTVTSLFIEKLRKKYKFQIIGIQPAIKPAAQKGGKCLVLTTLATAESDSFKNLNEKFGLGRCVVYPCRDLADYIEKNALSINVDAVKKMLPAKEADAVVLGCTHYAFVGEVIKKYYNCEVFDGVEGTCARLGEILGIFDHCAQRAQKISFEGGDCAKNRKIFTILLRQNGFVSLAGEEIP